MHVASKLATTVNTPPKQINVLRLTQHLCLRTVISADNNHNGPKPAKVRVDPCVGIH
jgi:hypothetical protein